MIIVSLLSSIQSMDAKIETFGEGLLFYVNENILCRDRRSCPEVFCKKVFLKILQNSQENSFLNRTRLVSPQI